MIGIEIRQVLESRMGMINMLMSVGLVVLVQYSLFFFFPLFEAVVHFLQFFHNLMHFFL